MTAASRERSVVPVDGLVSFARGVPSADLLPAELLVECVHRGIARHTPAALNYGPAVGYGPLREWLAAWHGVSSRRVIVTPGSMIALNLLIEAVLGQGGTAIVEEPTYDRALAAFVRSGAGVLPFDRSTDRVDLERLDTLLGAATTPKLLYLLPTFQNPTGRTLSLGERCAIADLAIAHGAVLLEDDPYGLLRFSGEPLPRLFDVLQQRGGESLASFVSSFSKTVAPGLRVGYLILPEGLVSPVERFAEATYISPPMLAQAQLLEFLVEVDLRVHATGVALALKPRLDLLVDAFADLGDAVCLSRPEGGYFVWVELPPSIDTDDLLPVAEAAGVTFSPGSTFHLSEGHTNTMRLAYSFASLAEIEVGSATLASLVRSRIA